MTITIAQVGDALALLCFLTCWFGYDLAAKRLARQRPSLISAVKDFRVLWMRRLCERENHIADATLLNNLLRGALFFASTTVFILGGLIAVLGAGGKATEAMGAIPYISQSETWQFEAKAAVLVLLFIYAFFKFTWSAWQYNVLSIMVGAVPRPGTDRAEVEQFVESTAQIATLAGQSYNKGVRAYYFSIALLAWFINPIVFLIATILVTYVMYRREFASPMLQSLTSVNRSN